MAKGCKKCDPHEICEECPEWIFTLADLIMCMMGLFVILWVLKPGITTPPQDSAAAKAKTDDFLETIGEIRGGFGWQPNPSSSDPIDQLVIRKRRGEGQGAETNKPRESPPGTDAENTSVRPGRQSIVGGRLVFETGETHFTPDTLRSLDEIAQTVKGHRTIVLVKGHTSLDDFAENASAEKKMDLSLRRAQAVADYLTAKGVEPDILRVQGCSTFEPIIQREYNAGSQVLNRRVEVEATATLVGALQDRSKDGVGPPATATP